MKRHNGTRVSLVMLPIVSALALAGCDDTSSDLDHDGHGIDSADADADADEDGLGPISVEGIEPPPATPFFTTPVEGYATQPPPLSLPKDPHRQGVWQFDLMLLAQYPTTSPGAIWADHGHSKDSDHYAGRAFDWMMNKSGGNASPIEKARGDSLVSWLLEEVDGVPHMRVRRLGIKYIVWYNRIWSTTNKGWKEHKDCLSGGNGDCHRNHVHFSFGEAGANGNVSWWGAAQPGPAPTPTPEPAPTPTPTPTPEPAPTPTPTPAATPQLTAFVGYGTGRLATYDPLTGQSTSTDLGVLPGTSPSVTRMRDGTYRVAFVGDGTSDLHIWDGQNLERTNLGVSPGTSPSISDMADGSYKVAFVGYGTDALHLYDGANLSNTQQGVHPGTSPSIAGLSDGGYEVAYVGYGTPYVYLYGTAENGQTDQGIRPETSPSITGLKNGGYEYAFVGLGTDTLIVIGAAGNTVTDQGVHFGTSPSIGALNDGGFEVAFRALGTDHLYYYGTAFSISTDQGIQSGTSPAAIRDFSF